MPTPDTRYSLVVPVGRHGHRGQTHLRPAGERRNMTLCHLERNKVRVHVARYGLRPVPLDDADATIERERLAPLCVNCETLARRADHAE